MKLILISEGGEVDEKAKEYVDKYQADKFFECATNRVFKIIPTIEGDKE